MDEPGQYGQYQCAEKRGQKPCNDEARHDECHRPEEKRIENKREQSERDDGNRQCENRQNGLNHHHNHRPHERDEQNRRPSAGDGDTGNDADGEIHRRYRTEVFQYCMHLFILPQAAAHIFITSMAFGVV